MKANETRRQLVPQPPLSQVPGPGPRPLARARGDSLIAGRVSPRGVHAAGGSRGVGAGQPDAPVQRPVPSGVGHAARRRRQPPNGSALRSASSCILMVLHTWGPAAPNAAAAESFAANSPRRPTVSPSKAPRAPPMRPSSASIRRRVLLMKPPPPSASSPNALERPLPFGVRAVAQAQSKCLRCQPPPPRLDASTDRALRTKSHPSVAICATSLTLKPTRMNTAAIEAP
jgi:hypothetical protein